MKLTFAFIGLCCMTVVVSAVDLDGAECLPIGSDMCVHSENCCNGYCDKQPTEEYGVCKEHLAETAIVAFTRDSREQSDTLKKTYTAAPTEGLCKAYEKTSAEYAGRGGDPDDPNSLTGAHPALPLGSMVYASVRPRGVLLKIVDRPPPPSVQGHVLRVSPAAARILNITDGLSVRCMMRVVHVGPMVNEPRAPAKTGLGGDGARRQARPDGPCKEDWVGKCLDDLECCSGACVRSPYTEAMGTCVPQDVKGADTRWA